MITKRNLAITKTAAETLGTVAGTLFFVFNLVSLGTGVPNIIKFPVSIGLGIAASVLSAILERKRQLEIEKTQAQHDENSETINTSLRRIEEEIGDLVSSDIEIGRVLHQTLLLRVVVEGQRSEEHYDREITEITGNDLSLLENTLAQRTLTKEISDGTEALSKVLDEASAAKEQIKRNSEYRQEIVTSRSTQSVNAIGLIQHQLELANKTREIIAKTQFNLFNSLSQPPSPAKSISIPEEHTPPSSTGAKQEIEPPEREPSLTRSEEVRTRESIDEHEEDALSHSMPTPATLRFQ